MTAAWHKGSIAEAEGTNVGWCFGGVLGLVGMCIRGNGLGCRVETDREGGKKERQKSHRRRVMAPCHLPTTDASSDWVSKVCTNWVTRACLVVGQGRMQRARQRHTDVCVTGHGQRNVAAAWAIGLGDEHGRSGPSQNLSLDFEIGMHVAHEEQLHSGIETNSLPHCRRLVERKPLRRLFWSRGRRKLPGTRGCWTGLALIPELERRSRRELSATHGPEP